MADFIVTMTHSGGEQAWRKSAEVLDASRNQAIMLGIDRLMELCQSEETPVPPRAGDYWREQRAAGGLLQDVLTNLEASFALTFSILEKVSDAPAPQPQIKPSRNGNGAAHAPKFDLNALLQSQLLTLQTRQKEVQAERKALQAEYEDNSAQIRQITSYLLLAAPKKARRKAAPEHEELAAS